MTSQKAKFEAKMNKVNAIKGRQYVDKSREVAPAIIESVAKREEERRLLEYYTSLIADKDREIAKLSSRITELENAMTVVREAAVGTEKPRTNGFRTPLHLWRMEQIRKTGTFVDPQTRAEWAAAGLLEYAPEEDDTVDISHLIDPSLYAWGTKIKWDAPGLRAMDIAFNEFDLERAYNPDFDVFDVDQVKKKWSTLATLAKPLTGLSLGRLLQVYAEERSLPYTAKKRGRPSTN